MLSKNFSQTVKKAMNPKTAQAALEYMLVVAFATGMVALGLTAFLMKSSETAKENDMQRIDVMGKEMLTAAKNVYYAGGASKETLRYTMPSSLVSISVTLHQLVFTVATTTGTSDLVYVSDVPLQGTFPSSASETQQLAHFIIEKSSNSVLICSEEYPSGC